VHGPSHEPQRRSKTPTRACKATFS
jgi:hypothetical protein